jgi:hypothetical protein
MKQKSSLKQGSFFMPDFGINVSIKIIPDKTIPGIEGYIERIRLKIYIYSIKH